MKVAYLIIGILMLIETSTITGLVAWQNHFLAHPHLITMSQPSPPPVDQLPTEGGQL